MPEVDTNDPRLLIATRLRETRLTVPHTAGQTLYYAVTAIDRYGNESAAKSELQANSTSQAHRATVTRTDGRRLRMPSKPSTLEADYLAIENMQGQLMTMMPYRGQYADISRLPEGMYKMRSVGRKGVTHQLGFFTVKRK